MMLIMSQMIPSVCFADCNQPTPRMFQVLLNSMHLPANGTCFSPHPSVVPADAISAAGFGSRAAAAEACAQYGAQLPPPAVLAGLQQQVPVSLPRWAWSDARVSASSAGGYVLSGGSALSSVVFDSTAMPQDASSSGFDDLSPSPPPTVQSGGLCTAVDTKELDASKAGALAPCSTELYAGCWLPVNGSDAPHRHVTGSQAHKPDCPPGWVLLPAAPSNHESTCVRLSAMPIEFGEAFAMCTAAGAAMYSPGQSASVDIWAARHALRSSSLQRRPRLWTAAAFTTPFSVSAAGGGTVLDLVSGATVALPSSFVRGGEILSASSFQAGALPTTAELHADGRSTGQGDVLLQPHMAAVGLNATAAPPTAGTLCVQPAGSAFNARQGLHLCPKHWVPVFGKCVLPSLRVPTAVPLSQRDAAHTCQAWGGSGLVRPLNAVHLRMVSALLQQHVADSSSLQSSLWWLGAAKLPAGGGAGLHWSWLDGQRMRVVDTPHITQVPAVLSWLLGSLEFSDDGGEAHTTVTIDTFSPSIPVPSPAAKGRRRASSAERALLQGTGTSTSSTTLGSYAARPKPTSWDAWFADQGAVVDGATLNATSQQWAARANDTLLPFVCELDPAVMCLDATFGSVGEYFQGACYSIRHLDSARDLPSHVGAAAPPSRRQRARLLSDTPTVPPPIPAISDCFTTDTFCSTGMFLSDSDAGLVSSAPPPFNPDNGADFPVLAPLTSFAHLRWVTQTLGGSTQHSTVTGGWAGDDTLVLGSLCTPVQGGLWGSASAVAGGNVSCEWVQSLDGIAGAGSFLPATAVGNLSSTADGRWVMHAAVRAKSDLVSPPVFSVELGNASQWAATSPQRTYALTASTAVHISDLFAEQVSHTTGRSEQCTRHSWFIDAVLVNGQCVTLLPLGAIPKTPASLLNACGVLGAGMSSAVPHAWAPLRSHASVLRSLMLNPYAVTTAHVGLSTAALWGLQSNFASSGADVNADGTKVDIRRLPWGPNEELHPPQVGPCSAVDVNGVLRSVDCFNGSAPEAIVCSAPVIDPCPQGWYMVSLPPLGAAVQASRVCWSLLHEPALYGEAVDTCAQAAPQWNSSLLSLASRPVWALAAAWRDVAGPQGGAAPRVWVQSYAVPTAAMQLAAELQSSLRVDNPIMARLQHRSDFMRFICELPSIPGHGSDASAPVAGLLLPDVYEKAEHTVRQGVQSLPSMDPSPSALPSVSSSVSPAAVVSPSVSSSVSPAAVVAPSVSSSVSPAAVVAPSASSSVSPAAVVAPPGGIGQPPIACRRALGEVTVSVNITLRVRSITPPALEALLGGASGSAIWQSVLLYRAYGAAYAAVLAPADRLDINQLDWGRLRVMAWFMYPRINVSSLWVSATQQVPPLFEGGASGVRFTLTLLTKCNLAGNVAAQASPSAARGGRFLQAGGLDQTAGNNSLNVPAELSTRLAAGVLTMTLNQSLPELQLPGGGADNSAALAARLTGQTLSLQALEGASFGPQPSLAEQLALIIARMQPSHPLANPPVGGSEAGCTPPDLSMLGTSTVTWCLQPGSSVEGEFGAIENPQRQTLSGGLTKETLDDLGRSLALQFGIDGMIGSASPTPKPARGGSQAVVASGTEDVTPLQLAVMAAVPLAFVVLGAAVWVAYRRRAGLALNPLRHAKTAPAPQDDNDVPVHGSTSGVLAAAPAEISAKGGWGGSQGSLTLGGHHANGGKQNTTRTADSAKSSTLFAPAAFSLDGGVNDEYGSSILSFAEDSSHLSPSMPQQGAWSGPERITLGQHARVMQQPQLWSAPLGLQEGGALGGARHVSLAASTQRSSVDMASNSLQSSFQHDLAVRPASLRSRLGSSAEPSQHQHNGALPVSVTMQRLMQVPSGSFATEGTGRYTSVHGRTVSQGTSQSQTSGSPAGHGPTHPSAYPPEHPLASRDHSGMQLSAAGSRRTGVASDRGYSMLSGTGEGTLGGSATREGGAPPLHTQPPARRASSSLLPGIGDRQMAVSQLSTGSLPTRDVQTPRRDVVYDARSSGSWLSSLPPGREGGAVLAPGPQQSPVGMQRRHMHTQSSSHSREFSGAARGTVWSGASIDTDAVMALHAAVMGEVEDQPVGAPRTPPASHARITLHDALPPASVASSLQDSGRHPSAVQPDGTHDEAVHSASSSSNSGSSGDLYAGQGFALSSFGMGSGLDENAFAAAPNTASIDGGMGEGDGGLGYGEAPMHSTRQWTFQ